MDKVNKILKARLSSNGLYGAATSAQICFLAEKWACGRLNVISYKRGELKILVKSSSAAQEISMQREEMIEYVNKKMERDIVKKVRIVTNN